ncbi:hypothetical protein [Bilophila wadsworthia]|uniref:hypothetical protein n=1 Tax=Bilophila wadsworthia TaxID=35833 RepID=UPI001D66F604|nr:hypothetical protein [Bilophila wadsworthia]MBS5376539.1 hypothetical protein [Bilophila wadsworthia]
MMRKIHTVFHLMLYLLISFSFGNNTPKSDASLPDTASKALLRQIDEACEKKVKKKKKKKKKKRMFRLWSEPGGYRRKKKLGGNRRGEREKQQGGLRLA